MCGRLMQPQPADFWRVRRLGASLTLHQLRHKVAPETPFREEDHCRRQSSTQEQLRSVQAGQAQQRQGTGGLAGLADGCRQRQGEH